MSKDKPMPDSPAANALGCKCPIGFPNMKGEGSVVDGVREWRIHPDCPVHSNPRWWYSRQ